METLEYMLIKYDLLSVEALDKIHNCLDLLCKYNYIEKKNTLKETYEETIGVYKLERTSPEMWNMVWNHKIQSLFQMEKQSGINGIAILKPTSVDDLAILNSTIRLMAQEKGGEMPTEKLARFKSNPNCWLEEMKQYGLTEKEKNILEPVLGISYGLCIAQEQFMELVQLPELGGFSLTWADKLRKSIAKKNPKEYNNLTQEFYKITEEKGIRKNFSHYVWDVLIAMSKGYGFNQSHTLAYSLIALQEMNLCYKYPIIFWNTACLITDSGSEGAGTNYDKIASAIGKMKNEGIEVGLPDINISASGFAPDVEKNLIHFGLKGISNISDDLIQNIISNRPYKNIKDFILKINPNKTAMVQLIKGGAFDNMMDRKLCMAWYLWETCDKKKKLNLQNLSTLMNYKLIPEDDEEKFTARRIFEFNRYLKAVCKVGLKPYYKLDERAINFLTEMNYDNLICVNGDITAIMIADWDKIYQYWMNVYRTYISSHEQELLVSLNNQIFKEAWEKYAKGNISAWEMESLCFYYHEHELKKANIAKYGIVPFDKIPSEPVVERVFEKNGKEIKLFQLNKICGTCIAKNKIKSSISLLTTTGVVEVKFVKDFFSLYDKQISQKNEKNEKHIVEKSWFNRGSMIVVMGMRTEDGFMCKKYASSSGHRLYKINEIKENGDLILQESRAKGELEEE